MTTIIIKVFVLTIIIISVQSLEQLQENGGVLNKIIQLLSNKPEPFRRAINKEPLNKGNLNKIIQIISNKPTPSRRAINKETLDKARNMYKHLTKNMNSKQIKQMLRDGQVDEEKDDLPADPEDKLAEEELKMSLSDMKSALYDLPHLEHEGKNDFLVLGHQVYDHFVTVVPNAMYQRVEKKCVNWLDDCSLKGIRARLLRGVRSPYR